MRTKVQSETPMNVIVPAEFAISPPLPHHHKTLHSEVEECSDTPGDPPLPRDCTETPPQSNANVQRFRGGLVCKAHRLCVSLNSRLESNEEERRRRVETPLCVISRVEFAIYAPAKLCHTLPCPTNTRHSSNHLRCSLSAQVQDTGFWIRGVLRQHPLSSELVCERECVSV